MNLLQTNTNVKRLFYFFTLLFISLCVYKVIAQIYSPYWQDLSDTASGVLTGHPLWIAYQNRLLGPYLVHLISAIGISNVSAIKLFTLLSITIQNLVLYGLLTKSGVSYNRLLSYIIFYSFIFICIQDYGFYTWDSIDAILFTFFAWGIFQGKSTTYFIFLFLVAIINRESALFISLYLIIDSFQIHNVKIHFSSKSKLAIGSLLTIGGIIYTKLIRDYLFISRPNGLLDTANARTGNQIHFLKNILDIFFNNLTSINILNSIFIIGSVIYLVYFIKYYTDRQIKAFAMFIILIVNIMIFGGINETRMYIILIPFLIFFQIGFGESKPDTATSGRIAVNGNL
jgi:hypothetical protein